MPPHDVHVWFQATGALGEAAIADAVSVLSDEERARCHRFRFADDGRDYAAAHALLRATLSRHGDRAPDQWRFDKAPTGKPFLIDQGRCRTSFSLSHTSGMVACAVTTDADVGIDVECVDRDVAVADVAARFFAPGETARLMIKSPWEKATALLTTEREGVRTYEKFALTSTQQTVSVKVREEDIPNVFVSVVLVKGRSGAFTAEDASDPGKPAFRIGYAELKVEDGTRRLAVAVKTDKEDYAPGERIRIPVAIEHGGPNVVEIEVATLPDELTAINNKAVLTIEFEELLAFSVLMTAGVLFRRNPAAHIRLAIGCICPPRLEVSTTNPGRSSASEPRP